MTACTNNILIGNFDLKACLQEDKTKFADIVAIEYFE